MSSTSIYHLKFSLTLKFYFIMATFQKRFLQFVRQENIYYRPVLISVMKKPISHFSFVYLYSESSYKEVEI